MNAPIRPPGAGHNRSPLASEIERRRTFAIISHPDAGKTTLTEKLLLFGGAIQLAGHVKAKRNRRSTQSDWMVIERERGISVVTSVMTFEYDGRVFNLLDTPGHEDFYEDTYRTLTAVNSAVMVIDAAKGIEARTRKLFEVCRLRDIPILTFINKVDREGRDPFELLDEIEKHAALDTAPVTWPVGRGCDLVGTPRFLAQGEVGHPTADRRAPSIRRSPALKAWTIRSWTPARAAPTSSNRSARAFGAGGGRAYPELDVKSYRAGHMTPVFFGSALRDYCVTELLHALAAIAPPPRPSPPSRAMWILARTRWRASCSRSRPTWTPTIGTASRFSGCARAASAGA